MNANLQKVMDAIADCDRFIQRESARNPELRPSDVQKTLDFYIAHRQKLIAMAAQA